MQRIINNPLNAFALSKGMYRRRRAVIVLSPSLPSVQIKEYVARKGYLTFLRPPYRIA